MFFGENGNSCLLRTEDIITQT